MKICRHEWYGSGCPICAPTEWCFSCDKNKPADGFEFHEGYGDRICAECYRALCLGCGTRLAEGVEEYCDDCAAALD